MHHSTLERNKLWFLTNNDWQREDLFDEIETHGRDSAEPRAEAEERLRERDDSNIQTSSTPSGTQAMKNGSKEEKERARGPCHQSDPFLTTLLILKESMKRQTEANEKYLMQRSETRKDFLRVIKRGLSMSIETLADLPLVAVEYEAAKADLEAAISALEAVSEERHVAMLKLEACEARKPDLKSSVDSLLSGKLNGSDPYQLLIAERALKILLLRKDAESCKLLVAETSKQRPPDMLQLTQLVTRVVDLLQQAKQLLPHQEDVVVECQGRTIDVVKGVMKEGLAKLGWAFDTFVKPLNWQEVSICFDWLLTLNDQDTRAALKPFFDPLCKKFVFHFLETPAFSRADLFGQAIKWVLQALGQKRK
jgi:hypothetical protein